MRKSQLPRGPGAVDGPSREGAVLLAVSWLSTAALRIAISWLLRGEGLGEALRSLLHRSGLEILAGFPQKAHRLSGHLERGWFAFISLQRPTAWGTGRPGKTIMRDNNEG